MIHTANQAKRAAEAKAQAEIVAKGGSVAGGGGGGSGGDGGGDGDGLNVQHPLSDQLMVKSSMRAAPEYAIKRIDAGKPLGAPA